MKKPPKESCSFAHRFTVADEDANYVGHSARYDAHLDGEHLWLSPKLSIPIEKIRAKEVIERGKVPHRRALRIVFDHPQTGVRDAVHLCEVDAIGFYHRQNLDALSTAIDAAIAGTPGAALPGPVAKLPPAAKPQSFWKNMYLSTIRPLTAPERAILDYYRSWAELWSVDVDERTSIERTQLALLDHAAHGETDTPIQDVFRLERAHLEILQAGAIWNIFWLGILPFWILGAWASAANARASVETFLGLAVGYFIAFGASVFVQGLLYQPFLSMLSRWLGHDIVYHSRQYW